MNRWRLVAFIFCLVSLTGLSNHAVAMTRFAASLLLPLVPARLLDWRFGTDPAEMQLGFSMQFFPGEQDGEATVEWTYKGETFMPASVGGYIYSTAPRRLTSSVARHPGLSAPAPGNQSLAPLMLSFLAVPLVVLASISPCAKLDEIAQTLSRL